MSKAGGVPRVRDSTNDAASGSAFRNSRADQKTSAGMANRRKNVTTACRACRERKTKCDGIIPCRRCITSQTECVPAADVDGRTAAAIKRKFDIYEHDQQLLNDLLDTIRDSSDEQVAHIISLVRSRTPLHDLEQCLRQQLSGSCSVDTEAGPAGSCSPSPNDGSRRQSLGALSTPRHTALQIARLVDEPLHRMSASPWTRVTNDDALVSNLISVWLTWDHIVYDWIDPELLLRDMRGGRVGVAYCSPFLVNCILARACSYSDYEEARPSHGKISRLMHDFIDEAKRLLDEEVALVRGPTLTLVQGLVYYFTILGLVGQDLRGWHYMNQAVERAQQLATTRQDIMLPDGTDASEFARAIDRTCWGVYHIATSSALASLRPQLMRVPQRSRPGLNQDRRPTWLPYPRPGPIIPSYADELFEVMCNFSIPASCAGHHIFKDHDDWHTSTEQGAERERDIVHLYLSLVRILSDLPDHLHPHGDAPPSVLVHHLWYHAIQLAILCYLKRPRGGASRQIQHLAKIRAVDVSVETARICKHYMVTFSSAPVVDSAVQGVSMSIFILTETPDIASRHKAEITDLCVCLRTLSRRWPFCMAHLRMA